jgi:Flp pilus assembly protein TadD
MTHVFGKGKAMKLTADAMKKIKAITSGEITWAEIGGITFERAQQIAQVGCDFASAGQFDEARQIFEGLVAVNPKDAAAHAALGTVYQQLGRTSEALAEYDAAIAIDGKNPVARANRGEIRIKRGDLKGLEDLTQAVTADPAGELPASRRAQALLKAVALAAANRRNGTA